MVASVPRRVALAGLGVVLLAPGLMACGGPPSAVERPQIALGGLPPFAVKERAGWPTAGWPVAPPEEVGIDPAALRRLEEGGPDDQGIVRWRRLAPEVGELLQRLGVPGFEVRVGQATVVEEGSTDGTWAFLGLPLPDEQRAELRLALAVRLPDLQQEQLMLLERVVGLMAGSSGGARQWVPTPRPQHEPPAEPSA